MQKIKSHFKNNLPIYLVLVTCIIIVGISLFVTKQNNKEEVETVDTSMFKVLTLEETLKRFEEDEPTLLVIGYKTCSATIHYTPYLQIAQAKYGYDTYYLELDSQLALLSTPQAAPSLWHKVKEKNLGIKTIS